MTANAPKRHSNRIQNLEFKIQNYLGSASFAEPVFLEHRVIRVVRVVRVIREIKEIKESNPEHPRLLFTNYHLI